MSNKPNWINWEDVANAGEEVGVHLNADLTKSLGHAVYSVLDKGEKSLGHTTSAVILEPFIHVNASQFNQHINHPLLAKTRNTLVKGIPAVAPPSGDIVPAKFGPGRLSIDEKTVFEVKTQPGIVRLRENIPASERTEVNPKTGKPFTQRMGEPQPGLILPKNTRSSVFAAGIMFGKHGASVVNPK